jgi:hypothetical protein
MFSVSPRQQHAKVTASAGVTDVTPYSEDDVVQNEDARL